MALKKGPFAALDALTIAAAFEHSAAWTAVRLAADDAPLPPLFAALGLEASCAAGFEGKLGFETVGDLKEPDSEEMKFVNAACSFGDDAFARARFGHFLFFTTDGKFGVDPGAVAGVSPADVVVDVGGGGGGGKRKSKLMREELRAWLAGLDLGVAKYLPQLASKGFDSLVTLRFATEAELTQFGITGGHARIILDGLRRRSGRQSILLGGGGGGGGSPARPHRHSSIDEFPLVRGRYRVEGAADATKPHILKAIDTQSAERSMGTLKRDLPVVLKYFDDGAEFKRAFHWLDLFARNQAGAMLRCFGHYDGGGEEPRGMVVLERAEGTLTTFIAQLAAELDPAKADRMRRTALRGIIPIVAELGGKPYYAVHNDLKPDNIFLVKKGLRIVFKLGDFDCTRRIREPLPTDEDGNRLFTVQVRRAAARRRSPPRRRAPLTPPPPRALCVCVCVCARSTRRPRWCSAPSRRATRARTSSRSA